MLTFDFAARSGVTTITDIADTTFSAIVSEAGAGPGEHFGGALLDSDFTNVGTLDGSFFTNLDDTAAAANGSFDFQRNVNNGDTQTGTGEFQSDKLN